jgi:hypothetical protein
MKLANKNLRLNNFILWCKNWYSPIDKNMNVFDQAKAALYLDGYEFIQNKHDIMNIILILVTGSFLLFGVATFKLLNVIALATESICLVGIMLFTGKPLKIELSKKFHV